MDWNDVSTERLTQAIENGRLTRRQMHQVLASVGAVSIGMAFGPKGAGAAAADHPTVFTWGGYEEAGFHAEYDNKYGGAPNFSAFGDEEEAFAKMRAGFEPDVVMACSYKVGIWRDAGIISPIDTSRLSHWDEIIPSLKNIDGIVADGERWWVCQDWAQTSITYRTDLVDIEEESWGLLWDKRYAGRLAMIDSLIDGVMVAAIYGGAKDPFNMTPDEVAMTKKLLQEQLPLLRFYGDASTTTQQALASGEVVAAATWNDSALLLSNQGLAVRFMQPKEGVMTWTCGLCLFSGGDPAKLDRSYDVINAYLSPETGKYEIEEWGFAHANALAFDLVSEEDLAARGFSRNPDDLLDAGIFQEPIGNEAELQAMFEEVKAGM